jgi:conjugative relaxase-like TrwC/TraI family protein
MVSVGKLAAGQADYYLDQAGGRVSRAASVASGAEDYYAGGLEAAGRWWGRGSQALGLKGTVGAEELRAVLSGLTPDGRGVLTGSTTRVPGFDVTFSAPKSVSLMFALGPASLRSAVLAAHTAAVEDALSYFEAEVAVARRGHNGVRLVRGRGLLAAIFVHRTSRAGDPQLHSHVLVVNAVQDETGRWSALDGRRVYQHARTAGFLYQTRLRAELTRSLGVEWTPVRRGVADVLGIGRSVLRAFSRRRVEVEEALREAGLTSPAAAETAALRTRRAKDRRLSAERLRPEWVVRAAALGVDEAALERLTGRASTRPLSADLVAAIKRELAGPEGLTQNTATFTRADALRALCELLPPGTDASVAELDRVVDDFLASRDVVPVLRPLGGLPSDFRYSTVELLRLEQRILDYAASAASPSGPSVTAEACARVLASRPGLSDEQRRMVERLTRGCERLAVVVGKAGTGKTFALDAARAAWESAGIPVTGAAVANRAARELADGAGVPSTSLAWLLARSGRRGLPTGVVVIVDEASMVGTRQLAELVEQVERSAGKLVLVGDDRQLPAVAAGGAFAALVARTPTVRLAENHRQVDQWERDALDLLRIGDVDSALGAYARRGRLTIGTDPEQTRSTLVADWWKAGGPDGGVMIAFRRADVRDLNTRARVLMRAAGRIGDARLDVAGRDFAAGDHVVLRRNDRRLGVANGEGGVVVAVDPRRRSATVVMGDRTVTLEARYLDAPSGQPLTHGYAVTGHVAQGVTVPHAFVLGSEAAYREWGYVAMSRGRQANHFYVVGRGSLERDEFAPAERASEPLDAIRAALARSRAERFATENRSRTLE